MRFLETVPIITAAVSGVFLVGGYIFQRTLEHKRAVAEKRREVYSMFLKATFAAIEARRSGKAFDGSEEIFWKAQISLYGSDEVVRKLGVLTLLLPRGDDEPRESSDGSRGMAAAFDELMLAMRQDITPRTGVELQNLRRISPLLTDLPEAVHPQIRS